MVCAPSCSTALALLARASAILADTQEGADRTWPQGELVGHLNEALCELRKLRPDAFTRIVTLTLEPGAAQSLPAEYAAFVGLLSNTTTDESGVGAVTSAISESDARYVAALKKKPCLNRRVCADPGDKPYAIMSYTRDPHVETAFTVSPPVPFGEMPQVRAKVVVRPQRFTTATMGEAISVGCEYEASLLDWVLMRSYAKETESQYALAQVERYRKAWYDAFNAAYLQDSRWNGGYWTGQDLKRPMADPNFRQH